MIDDTHFDVWVVSSNNGDVGDVYLSETEAAKEILGHILMTNWKNTGHEVPTLEEIIEYGGFVLYDTQWLIKSRICWKNYVFGHRRDL